MDFNEVMGKLNQAEELLRSANMVDDENAKNSLTKTMSDVLASTIELLRVKEEEADDDE